jgi:hypothetical protein
MFVMLILREILHDLLYFLMIVNGASGVFIWASSIHQAFVMAGERPDGRGLLTLRRVLPSEWSEAYYASRRKWMRLAFAFLAVIAVQAFLFWLDILFFRKPN